MWTQLTLKNNIVILATSIAKFGTLVRNYIRPVIKSGHWIRPHFEMWFLNIFDHNIFFHYEAYLNISVHVFLQFNKLTIRAYLSMDELIQQDIVKCFAFVQRIQLLQLGITSVYSRVKYTQKDIMRHFIENQFLSL